MFLNKNIGPVQNGYTFNKHWMINRTFINAIHGLLLFFFPPQTQIAKIYMARFNLTELKKKNHLKIGEKKNTTKANINVYSNLCI